jgi:hypothetical protein
MPKNHLGFISWKLLHRSDEIFIKTLLALDNLSGG